jgi:superfamily II DNA or RNA helicase
MPRDPNIENIAEEGSDSLPELFYNDRLHQDWLKKSDWPSRIDQAAIDLNYGISLGVASNSRSTGLKPAKGALITAFDFGDATGGFYKEGLIEIVGNNSDLPTQISEYDDRSIGDLAYRLNEFRHELSKVDSDDDTGDITDLPRALEAVIEKEITQSMRRTNTGVSQALHTPETAADAMFQIFSDPSSREYADQLVEQIGNRDLMELLDAPEMVTPLWQHQQAAIKAWIKQDCKGYVNMATATGKTVLGLAAIAVCFGDLHPVDADELATTPDAFDDGEGKATVLIVAGQELLLQQWRSEFDEHLDIPRDRTALGKDDTIELKWGNISFSTADKIRSVDAIGKYDLVILDEAHRYKRGSRSGKGWGAVLDDLTQKSEALLAMSGSVDRGWLGDDSVQEFIESRLSKCIEFTVPEAREAGVIADFSWDVRYATASESESVDQLEEETQQLKQLYNQSTHNFEMSRFDVPLPESVPEQFETITDIKSFGQSNEGSKTREASAAFDQFATAASSRRPIRWQLKPILETVGDLVARHAPEQKVVVLVESYSEAESVGDAVAEQISGDLVLVPDADAEEQDENINEFRSNNYRVIVGPGKVLGTGVDMPEADVAINIAKGGVNASLIQRIGRVLRNPDGDKEAKFHHIVTLPGDDGAVIPGQDGRRHLQRASEFRALGDRLRELPGFTAHDGDVKLTLRSFEKQGAQAIAETGQEPDQMLEDEIAAGYLSDLIEQIDSSGVRGRSVLLTQWEGETLEQPHETRSDTEKDVHEGSSESAEESDSLSSSTIEGKQIDIEKAVDGISKSSTSNPNEDEQTTNKPSRGGHQTKLPEETNNENVEQESTGEVADSQSFPSKEGEDISQTKSQSGEPEPKQTPADGSSSEESIGEKIKSLVRTVFRR